MTAVVLPGAGPAGIRPAVPAPTRTGIPFTLTLPAPAAGRVGVEFAAENAGARRETSVASALALPWLPALGALGAGVPRHERHARHARKGGPV